MSDIETPEQDVCFAHQRLGYALPPKRRGGGNIADHPQRLAVVLKINGSYIGSQMADDIAIALHGEKLGMGFRRELDCTVVAKGFFQQRSRGFAIFIRHHLVFESQYLDGAHGNYPAEVLAARMLKEGGNYCTRKSATSNEQPALTEYKQRSGVPYGCHADQLFLFPIEGSEMSTTQLTDSASLTVYKALRRDIERGEFAPGASLPTISNLAKSYGITRYAARCVMERLRDEGRAQSWQGKGFYVAMPMIKFRLDVRRPVFGDRIQEMGLKSQSELIRTKTVGLPVEVAQRIRNRPGTKAKMTETLRKVNGRPVALSIDYFPGHSFEGLEETLAETGSISRSLAIHGVSSYSRDYTSLDARLPSAHEALMLAIPRSQPVYATLGANLSPNGKLVQISRGIWRADCVSYEF